MDATRRLEVVERENAELRERVRQLEDTLFARDAVVPWEWGLTPSERRVLGVLIARDLATKPAVLAALYTGLGRDEAEERIVDVFICKIRRKLTPFGVGIVTHWGQGFELDREWRQRLRPGPARAAA